MDRIIEVVTLAMVLVAPLSGLRYSACTKLSIARRAQYLTGTATNQPKEHQSDGWCSYPLQKVDVKLTL